MKVRLHLLSLFLVFAGLACGAGAAPKSLYFESPEQAIKRTTELLRAKNWSELARYYDLAGTGFALADLRRGTFFLRTTPPAEAHPSGVWKYREPFAPGSEFISMVRDEEPNVYEVTVGLAIDEGDGRVQRTRTTFYLRQSPAGFQLLPSARTPRAGADPAYDATGGISVTEAAWRANVDYDCGDWHAHYSAPLATWFFASGKAAPVALERVAVPNPPLPPKAPPGFEPRPWRWTVRALPAVDVVAVDELGNGPDGTTLFESLPGDFWNFVQPGEAGQPELAVARDQIWPLLERARAGGWKLKVVVRQPAAPQARAVLTLVHP